MTRILSALIGYIFGNFLFGFLYGKIHNKDIRKMGSGNVGTTNTVRTMGVLPGLITLICDMCKVILAYFVSGIVFSH
nr:glycerol-3-phosphate acyltransferase [Lachnospiraceae bacterium]